MPRTFIAILISFAIIGLGACKKSGTDKPAKPPIHIEGFQLFDYFGNPMGRIGPADSDWLFINQASLSALEQSFFNSGDSIDPVNTVVTNVQVTPFPNPVSNSSALHINATDSVKFRLTITDSTGIVLQQLARKLKGATVMLIDLSDRNKFPNRRSLRYYYSFSAAANPNFKVGYGDIKVCDYNAGQEPVTVCFQ